MSGAAAAVAVGAVREEGRESWLDGSAEQERDGSAEHRRHGSAEHRRHGPAEPPWHRSAEHPGHRSAEHPWAVREAAVEAYDPAAVAEERFECEADALEALGDEIAWLAAHLHAGRGRYLVLVAAFDRRRGWEPGGHRSCAHWLVVRTGYDLRTAREHVRVARALEVLPKTSASIQSGQLSFSQVRALTRVATPDTEEELLELAEGCTTSTLERRVRAWRKGTVRDEAARERALHRSRRLTVTCDEDGGYLIRGRLEPEVGAVLLRALEAASDALYGAETEDGSAEHHRGGSAEPPSPRQALRAANRRRADAIGLLAERALAAGLGAEGDEEAPISGTRAERWLAFLHVDIETLAQVDDESDDEDAADDTAPGRSELEDGTRLAPETARRLCCDVGTVQVATAGTVPLNSATHASVLDVGRKTRTIPPALRRALEVRDRGCRFPGCGLRFCDGHHIVHWSDGGTTCLENLISLCRRHHRLVHEEGWTVAWWGREKHAVFTDPRGKLHIDAGWTAPELPEEPVAELEREHRERGIEPGPLTPSARWKRERDVPDEVWLAADEAALVAREAKLTPGSGTFLFQSTL